MIRILRFVSYAYPTLYPFCIEILQYDRISYDLYAYSNLVRILRLLIEQKLLIKKKKKLIEQKTTHNTYPDLKIHFTC